MNIDSPSCRLLESILFDPDSSLSFIQSSVCSPSGVMLVHFLASLEVIGWHAFISGTQLTLVTVEEDSKSSQILTAACYGTGLTSVHLPRSVGPSVHSCFTCVDRIGCHGGELMIARDRREGIRRVCVNFFECFCGSRSYSSKLF
jgi:hypothetical protein